MPAKRSFESNSNAGYSRSGGNTERSDELGSMARSNSESEPASLPSSEAGEVVEHISVGTVEWQNRGTLHVHLLLWL
ncbi:hypothetical protein CPB83DRAFT_849761 [Crepidotus variabilis]|uniref:Uncharacterized protein n=1 Tax=Crepidotus variabilis TaxID=179855 RepID=A0A9P6EL52_9AGAR|nr:hypothetical protein CPB83DRAFT_849761 [Crepidotus variabilis]